MSHSLPVFRPAPSSGSHKGRLAGVRFKSACEQGQTSTQTGCTPESGEGGKKPHPTYSAHEGHRAAQVAELDEANGVEAIKSKLSHAKETVGKLYHQVKERKIDRFSDKLTPEEFELLKKHDLAEGVVHDLEKTLAKKRRRALRLPIPPELSESDRKVLEKAKEDQARARATGSFQHQARAGRAPSSGRRHGERAAKEAAAEQAKEAQIYIDGLLDRVLRIQENQFAPKPEAPAVKSLAILTKSFDDPPHEKPKPRDPTLYTFRTGLAGKYRVRVVNGTMIRNSSLEHQEFGLYGIHADFPEMVPAGEIWVAGRLPIAEMEFFVAGAAAELRALEAGETEDDAYEISKKVMAAKRAEVKDRFKDAGNLRSTPVIDESGYAHIDSLDMPTVHVYDVDADMVREKHKVDYLEGGNSAVYKWIPRGQNGALTIWLESDLETNEAPLVALHEYVEGLLMDLHGLTYDHAHALACRVEWKYRRRWLDEGVPFLQGDVGSLLPSILDEVPGIEEIRAKHPIRTNPERNKAKALSDGSLANPVCPLCGGRTKSDGCNVWCRSEFCEFRERLPAIDFKALVKSADAAPHKYSSTQFNLDDAGYNRTQGPPVPKLQRLAAAIPDEDLAEDGREDRFHVTVKYGLHTTDPEEVEQVVRDWLKSREGRRGQLSVSATLGDVSIFEGDEDDVVKIDVKSDDLHSLNKTLASLPHTDTHPEYKPHVTLAYVKKGTGQRHVGEGMGGHEIILDRLVFSDPEKNRTEIEFKQLTKALSYLNNTTGGALVAPPQVGLKEDEKSTQMVGVDQMPEEWVRGQRGYKHHCSCLEGQPCDCPVESDQTLVGGVEGRKDFSEVERPNAPPFDGVQECESLLVSKRKALRAKYKKWVTMGGTEALHDGISERHHGGTPVDIEGGVIKKGPAGTVGKKPSQLHGGKPTGQFAPKPVPPKVGQTQQPQAQAQPQKPDNKVAEPKPAYEDHKAIEQATEKRARENYEQLRDVYLKGDAAKGKEGNGTFDSSGNLTSVVLNTDDWRDLFPEYHGTNSGDVHEASSFLNKQLWLESLETMKGKGNNKVIVLAGGGGSGKSGVSKFIDANGYPIRLDQVSDHTQKLEGKIEEAKKAGFETDYVFVDREPADAFLNGVLTRAVNLRKKGKLARTVKLEHALRANIEARKTALDILKRRPDLPVRVLDNTKGFENTRMINDRDEAIAHLEGREYDYDTLHKQLADEILKRYENGELEDDIAGGLLDKQAIAEAKYKKEAKNEPGGVRGSGEVPADNASGPVGHGSNHPGRDQVRGGSGASGKLPPHPEAAGGAGGAGKEGRAGEHAGVQSRVGRNAGHRKGLDYSVKAVRKGTCKQGERADLTGCTPASEEAAPKKYRTMKDEDGNDVRVPESVIKKTEEWRKAEQKARTRGALRAARESRSDEPKNQIAAKQLDHLLSHGVVIGESGPWVSPRKYPDAKYPTALKYVQDQGLKFEGSPLPEGIERGTPQLCFQNATQLVIQNPGWSYAEGFAMREGLMPVLHAWAVTEDGKVVDNTWDEPENSAYLGVVYDRGPYMKYIFKAKYYGILGGANKNAEKIIAKGGL